MNQRRALTAGVLRALPGVFALLLVSALPALACSVCFGDPESPQTQGMNSAILFLLGVIGSVLAAFASMFVYWVARSRRMATANHQGVEL